MYHTEQPDDNLAAINSATIGTAMPVVILPDGQKVQTGTVAALLINIRAYDELVSGSNPDEGKMNEMEARMAASLPVLKKVGIFQLFTPEEWTQGTSAGRKFIGELAFKEGA
ncbi:hypothetical protein BU26DRAFT_547488 [Trematosphaeria pertusa]|uniref:DUF7709 domain-containing protein n=1 Tax=Trematosphaeria pertusa TaxID=390896 RepID=A0A6A6ISM6_9PLEO|nr:uncharacterized protein BU26DRAFT_547488 [Trematosphaeria pertusa]KAF2252832.1 hypothetical protein BU26DRAFT_547488 [Trematosphaeria pertusa]